MWGVAVVAATRIYRDGIAHALAGDGELDVLAALSGQRDELQLLAQLSPDVVVLDMASQRDDGQLHAIRRLAPSSRIVVLGATHTEESIIRCAEAGVAGYVEAQAGIEELIAVVHGALRDELVCSPRLAGMLLRQVGRAGPPPHPEDSAATRLTRREVEILRLIDAGMSNKEIGSRLHIELGTVKAHVHSLLDKLGVHRRSQAAARWRELECQYAPAHVPHWDSRAGVPTGI
jgi:DNA-binding NarL/FixJ family response regulator